MPRLAHQDPSEGKDLHEALRDVSPAEAEEFKKNVLSPAEIERRKNRKANPTPSRPEVLMSDTALRASLIRLAFQNPSLRADILPLVSKEAGSYQEYVDRKRSKGEKPLTEDAWRSRTQGGGKGEKKDEGKGKGKGEDTGGRLLLKEDDASPVNPTKVKGKGIGEKLRDLGVVMPGVAKALDAGKAVSRSRLEYAWERLNDWASSGSKEIDTSVLDAVGEALGKSKGKAGQPAEKKPAKSFKKNYRPKMESVMKKHELTDDDAAQVIQFSIDRPKKGKPQSPAELMRRFMQNAKPETKARMKNMSPAEFMIMLRAVLDQEEGGGKAASLRTAAIRFAHENPALRKHVLAALKEADEGSPEADKSALAEDADPKSHDQNLASTWEKVDGSKQASTDKTALAGDTWGRQLNDLKKAFMEDVASALKGMLEDEGFDVQRAQAIGVVVMALGERKSDGLKAQVIIQWNAQSGGAISVDSVMSLGEEKRQSKFPVLSYSAENVASQALYKHFEGLLP